MIPHEVKIPFYNVTVASPDTLEDTSMPIYITKDPVVIAGEGLSTLSTSIVTLAIAEAVGIAPLIE